jgi:hypothetical protein
MANPGQSAQDHTRWIRITQIGAEKSEYEGFTKLRASSVRKRQRSLR